MIGRYEAALVLACRRAEHTGSMITEDQAQEIAAFWHSPNRRDMALTAFSHSGTRLPSLRSEVEREINDGKWQDAVSRLELRSLLAWIIANPIEVIRFEQVFYYQGHPADEILAKIYPDWTYGSASTGWPDGAASTLAEVMCWDYGEPSDSSDSYEHPASTYGSSFEESEEYVLAWNFGLTWVSLSRKIKEIG